MSMLSNNQEQIWNLVQGWPPSERLSLASRLIQSLENERAVGESTYVKPADLINVWKCSIAPTDEEVDKIVDDERLRKFG